MAYTAVEDSDAEEKEKGKEVRFHVRPAGLQLVPTGKMPVELQSAQLVAVSCKRAAHNFASLEN
jgi:hypothetical protein